MAKEKNRYASIRGGYIGYDTYLFFSYTNEFYHVQYKNRYKTPQPKTFPTTHLPSPVITPPPGIAPTRSSTRGLRPA